MILCDKQRVCIKYLSKIHLLMLKWIARYSKTILIDKKITQQSLSNKANTQATYSLTETSYHHKNVN